MAVEVETLVIIQLFRVPFTNAKTTRDAKTCASIINLRNGLYKQIRGCEIYCKLKSGCEMGEVNSPPTEGCPQGGVVISNSAKCPIENVAL